MVSCLGCGLGSADEYCGEVEGQRSICPIIFIVRREPTQSFEGGRVNYKGVGKNETKLSKEKHDTYYRDLVLFSWSTRRS